MRKLEKEKDDIKKRQEKYINEGDETKEKQRIIHGEITGIKTCKIKTNKDIHLTTHRSSKLKSLIHEQVDHWLGLYISNFINLS